MKRLGLLLGLACFLASPAQALYVEVAKARYEIDSGVSRYYEAEITFLSGDELNQAMISFSYRPLEQYAVFFWGEGTAAIVSLGMLGGCGLVFTQSCLSINRQALGGRDQDGRRWEICTHYTC